MYFAFRTPQSHGVWMPDMHFPIDVAWIANGKVVGVLTLQPCSQHRGPEQCPVHNSPGPVDAMLEVPKGALSGVHVGDAIVLAS